MSETPDKLSSNWRAMDSAPRDGTEDRPGTEILVAVLNPPDEAAQYIRKHHGPCEQRIVRTIASYWRGKWRNGPDEIFPPFAWDDLPSCPPNPAAD